MIVISSSQDEKVFQKEANQIFKKEVESKDRNYRMTEQIKPKLTAK